MSESAKNPDFRLLLTGDLHIGRSSSRIPVGVSPDSLRAATAWDRIVQLAIEEKVDAVLLSGDIADEQNKFWEAIGPLEAGVRLLTENGIHTVAVAGNHDFEVLGKLATQLAGNFTLLGRNGHWERITLENQTGPVLHIDGWSFKSRHVDRSPLDDYEYSTDPVVPTLGLVHGDLNAAGSHYAPLDQRQLETAGPDAWLLGHVHKPQLIDGNLWILYPGSPQALDFGETGKHGPWIAEIRNGRIETPEQIQLSTVWYESLSVDATGVAVEDDLRSEIKDALRARGDSITGSAGSSLENIVMRLRVEGHSALAGSVADSMQEIERDLRLTFGTVTMTVDRARSELLPEIDLEQHAGQNSVLGTVATLLLELDKDERSEAVEELIEETRLELEQARGKSDFLSLSGRRIGIDDIIGHLRHSGRELLIQLLNQNDA
jgi:DNA repair protein SbcD/Mre11